MKNRNLIPIAFLLCLCTKLVASVSLGDIYRDTIINDVDLVVPSEYATVQDALLFLDDKKIGLAVLVTIKIEDGTYSNYDSIIIDHTQGDRIQIIGNQSSPSNVILQFKSGASGILMQKSKTIYLIDGITFDGNNTAQMGVRIYDNCSATLGSNCTIKNFTVDGVYISEGSTLRCNGITVQNNGRDGLKAYRNATIIADSVTSKNNGKVGFSSNSSSVISAASSTSQNNGTQGFLSYNNSYIYAVGTTSTGNSPNYSTQDVSYIQQ